MKNNYAQRIIEDKEILKVSDYSFVLSALIELSDSHSPPLIQCIPSIEDYAKKIVKNAEIYIYGDPIAAIIAFYNNDKERGTAYITEIAVKKAYQGIGLGKLMLYVCFNRAREEKMKLVKLEVYKDNLTAIRFYERNGFIVLGDASDKTQYMVRELC